MQLELPVRWTERDKEKQEIENLKKGDSAEDIVKHTYGKLLIDSLDIGPYYDLDPNHTMITDKLGKLYCVTIPLDQFKKILTEVTGKAIMAIVVREEPFQKPKGKKGKDDDDIFM